MNKVLILISLLLGTFAFGQDGIYVYDGYQDDENCSLYLVIREGKYLLGLGYQASPDILTGTSLSIGTSRENGSCYILKDELFGYTMMFERIDSGLFVLKRGFAPMSGIAMKYLSSPMTAPFMYSSDTRNFHRNPYSIKRDNRKARREHRISIKAGRYVMTIGFENTYLLNLDDSGRYFYQYRGLTLSEGEWRRSGNLLILKDDGLNKPFFAIIKECGIISSFLPGAYCDDELIPVH